MRRYLALVGTLFLLAVAAPAALADSIVYEKNGNVWLANPDGTGQRQLTSSGGYSKPTQADDGTIVAVKGKLLHRLDRSGRLLNLAGDSSGTGPITPALSPDASLVAYNFFNTGSITPGFRTALSYSNRQTSNDEIFNIGGWSNPSWIGNGMVLMFDGSETFTGDTLIKTLGVTATQPWYEDAGMVLTGGEVDAGRTRLAATDGAIIRLYRLNAPPPAIAVEPRCDLSNPTGSFFRPTWSPDGRSLAWQEDDGIWAADIDLDNCTATQPEPIVAGGKAPDWGPVAAGRRLSATAPKRVTLGALLKGLRLRVNCQCTVSATMLLAKKPIGKAKRVVSRATTLKVKPNAKGRARLRRGGTRVTVVIGGGGRFVTRKVRVVR
ncbi:MAG: hypothetical protein QOI32_1775 [Thermoleophilaceae bacterium]|nr:hypothetical protein [Thermoleophilaceae bacterium]